MEQPTKDVAQIITSPSRYMELFSEAQRKEAFKYAHDIRKFEIDLYWKRAAYFWTLLTATFGGYFLLVSRRNSGDDATIIFAVSCIGLVLSTGWYLVNRGSKYWQENWERHVDSLEDSIAGPLYKTAIADRQFQWWKPHKGYPYSVSKVNQLISLFVMALWLGIFFSSFPGWTLPPRIIDAGPCLLFATTVIFVLALFTLGLGGTQRQFGPKRGEPKDRPVDFRKSDLVSSPEP